MTLEEINKKLDRNLAKGWNDEKLNSKYRELIGSIKKENTNFVKAKEVVKKFNAKTGIYESK